MKSSFGSVPRRSNLSTQARPGPGGAVDAAACLPEERHERDRVSRAAERDRDSRAARSVEKAREPRRARDPNGTFRGGAVPAGVTMAV